METADFVAETRLPGSRLSRRLRRGGRLPINVHFKGQAPVALHIDQRRFGDALRKHVRILNLTIAGKTESVVIENVDHDPLSQDMVHVDLRRVDLKEKVDVVVALSIRGPAEGELAGGQRIEQAPSIRVRCLPLAIPAEIEVDIRKLKLHEAAHVRDLILPEGVEAVESPDHVLVMIVEPRASKEAAPVAEGAVETSEPELIRTPKKDEDAPEG